MSTDLHQLTQRAIKLHTGKLGAQQPAADLSGPATAGGHDYIVLTISRALKRLKRWPKELE